MEYLELYGVVKLKHDIDKSVLIKTLKAIEGLPFDDGGSIVANIEGDYLFMIGEGTLSDSRMINTLLNRLKVHVSEQSTIDITHVRWEVLVELKHLGYGMDCRHQLSSRQRALIH